MKLEDINNGFERVCREAFQFLESDFGFRVTRVEKDGYGCRIMYTNPTTGIRVNNDLKDGYVFVTGYRLLDGYVPEYPMGFDPRAELLVFDFQDLLATKGLDGMPQIPGKAATDPQYMERFLHAYAERIRRHAKGVLKGDFSILPKIKEIVAKRVRGWE